MLSPTIIALVAAFAASTYARTFTIYNGCPFTVWPAYFTNPDSPAQINRGTFPAGWEAGAYTHITVTVPDGWAGRFWARRPCDFSSGSNLPTTCVTGGCNGGLVCDASTGTGVPPATLAEFALNKDQNNDFYDVSNVDGSNLPVRINNTKGCPVPQCYFDLNSQCPGPLQVKNSAGAVVGCLSACQANLDGNHANSANCCTGSHNTAATCPSSGVEYYSYFKGNCPDAYAYAYDEASGSALWTCSANGGGADYTVTFCPP